MSRLQADRGAVRLQLLCVEISCLTGGERQCRLDTSSVRFIVDLESDSQRIRLRNVIRWLFCFQFTNLGSFSSPAIPPT